MQEVTGSPTPPSTPSELPTLTPTQASTPTRAPAVVPTTDNPATTPTLTNAPALEPTRKLLAIYMVGSDLEDGGDNGLESGMAGTNDLFELIEGYESLPEKDSIEILVAFGGADKDGWRGMKFADMPQIIEDSLDDWFGNEESPNAYLRQHDGANMDDEESLKEFLDFLRDEYADSDRRFLTFWDHGNSYKGFGGDTNFNNDGLSMDEIASAFQRSQAGVFDLIGFDACFMAGVEVAKVIQSYAQYMMASEDLEPGHGWLWSEVVEIYAREDSIVEAGKQMVESFVDDVHGGPRFDGRTLSLVDLSRYDSLVAALDPVIEALGSQFPFADEYATAVASGISRAGTFGESERDDSPAISIDLQHLIQLMAAEFSGTDLEPLLGELLEEIDRYIVHSSHDGSRPHANGVSIAAPADNDPKYSEYKLSDTWLDFQKSYDAFTTGDTVAPTVAQQTSDEAGTWATFTDENLTEVTTVYGFVEAVAYDDGTVDDVFMVVAELEAQPTSNEREYFTPSWDQLWFTVEYDSSEITAWIPASFDGRFEDEYGECSTYTAEIDFYLDGSTEPNLAVLTLYVDENWQVFDHSIQTYQYVYSGPDDKEGTIRFDKATYQLIPGDSVQFWNFGYNLHDAAYDDWFQASDIVTFSQEPVFGLEELLFVDEHDRPLDYYYAMYAEDVNGNGVLTELYPATP